MLQNNRADLLIRNALIFDGSGERPFMGDLAVRDGRVMAMGKTLDAILAADVRDAEGQWLIPGMLDIHTHLDLEMELDPRLPEVVRHGTTTVVVANCSLGLAFGALRKNGEDPIVDCFARVENLPKSILRAVADKVTWKDSAGYLDHLASLPLGPNVVPLVPHSMLRCAVMGLQGSVSRKPDADDMQAMKELLGTALQQGYAGFSTDALPFHYLAMDPNRKTRIPTQFADFQEIRQLTDVVREQDRVWQATPPKDDRWLTFKTFALTSGRLFGKPLRLTAVAALDVVSNRSIARMAVLMSRLLNSRLLQGRFRLQALAAPFRVYADGILTPLAEETPCLRELNEPDHEDAAARRSLLRDPAFRARFRKEWFADKTGFSVARIKRVLGIMDDTLRRDLADMQMTGRPLACWKGVSLATVFGRYRAWQSLDTGRALPNGPDPALTPEESKVFAELPGPITDDCDFFLAMLERFDTDLRWSALAANDRPSVVRKLLFDTQILPGFNDSGAHLTNMAFYDGNLRGLQIAQLDGLRAVSRHVSRLTREPAEFFGVDAGRLEPGCRADMVLLKPLALARYDSEANVALQFREALGHEQMVNRSDGVVDAVWIGGQCAWNAGEFDRELGKKPFGRPLLARSDDGVVPNTTEIQKPVHRAA